MCSSLYVPQFLLRLCVQEWNHWDYGDANLHIGRWGLNDLTSSRFPTSTWKHPFPWIHVNICYCQSSWLWWYNEWAKTMTKKIKSHCSFNFHFPDWQKQYILIWLLAFVFFSMKTIHIIHRFLLCCVFLIDLYKLLTDSGCKLCVC